MESCQLNTIELPHIIPQQAYAILHAKILVNDTPSCRLLYVSLNNRSSYVYQTIQHCSHHATNYSIIDRNKHIVDNTIDSKSLSSCGVRSPSV